MTNGGIYNFVDEINGFLTTRAETTLDIFDINNLSISVVSEKVVGQFSYSGLSKSEMFDIYATTFDDCLMVAEKLTNLNEPDVAKWMKYATANMMILDAFTSDFRKNGGVVVGVSGDGYIPGVNVSNLYFKSELGKDISNNGYATVLTPYGNVNVPVPGKKDIQFSSLLAWAAVPLAFIKQWVGTLVKYIKLPKGISSRTRFPISGTDNGFMNGPLYIVHDPEKRRIRNFVYLRISSEKPQTVSVSFYSLDDYTKKYGEIKLNARQGENEYKIKMRCIKGVPPMLVKIQPEDNITTYMDLYKVKAGLL